MASASSISSGTASTAHTSTEFPWQKANPLETKYFFRPPSLVSPEDEGWTVTTPGASWAMVGT